MNYGGWLGIALALVIILAWGRGHRTGHLHQHRLTEAERERAIQAGMMLGSQLLAEHLMTHHRVEPEMCGMLQHHENRKAAREMQDAVDQVIAEHETPP